MEQIQRMWMAFAAIGAGIVHVALVVTAPLPLAVFLLALGVAELVWGVVALARDRLPTPVAALVVALAPALGWAAALLIGEPAVPAGVLQALRPLPMAVATALALFVAGALTVRSRRRSPRREREVPAGRSLIALFAGALLAGSLVTPALAATQAGEDARPHGSHGTQEPALPEPEHDH